MPDPIAGRISPAVEAFVGDVLQELGNIDPIDSYIDMCRRSPYAGPAVEVVVLMGLASFGEYTHPEPEKQAFIRKCFERMDGSLRWSVAELLSVKPIGRAVAEWAPRESVEEWTLEAIATLDPRKYTFEGKLGRIEQVKYFGQQKDLIIPYDRCIHLINQRWLSFGDPRGVADSERAAKSWEAWKIIMSVLLIASKRQGTPLLIGYADSEQKAELLDHRGEPLRGADGNVIRVSATQALMNQLIETDNNSVLVTQLGNKVEAIAQSEGRSFLFEVLKLLGMLQMLGFMVPETILTATGAGDSNLNTGQRSILQMSVEATIADVQEGILEGPVRSLLTWNYGEQESYGSFEKPKEDQVDRVQLLSALSNAIYQGVFSAEDLAVINRMRSLSGIPPVEERMEGMSLRLPLNYWRENGNGVKVGAS